MSVGRVSYNDVIVVGAGKIVFALLLLFAPYLPES